MNVAAAVFVLAPALALGSFLNVVVARVPARRSLLRPPSSCGTCSREILWRDNLPVVSYFLLRGRCRHCGERISPHYPLVEAGAAALIVACVSVFGLTSESAFAAGFCAVLVTLSAIDAQLRIVPNRIVLPAAGAALVLHTISVPSAEWILAAVAAAGLLSLAVLANPKGLGLGDVKLALLMGAVLGASVSVALVLGLLAAFVPAAGLVMLHGPRARKLDLPLVPFLSSGAVVALFFGDEILAYLVPF